METQFKMIAGSDASFITFLCTNSWAIWLPFLEKYDEKWKHIFERDLHRCSNPVCERHEATAHHITFKSRGGTDAPGNLTSACWICHLEAIHGGRLKVEGDASKLTWEIGREPILKVVGREKIPLVV